MWDVSKRDIRIFSLHNIEEGCYGGDSWEFVLAMVLEEGGYRRGLYEGFGGE